MDLTSIIFRLAPDILDPDPESFMTNEKGEKKRGSEAMGPGGDNGGWSGEATRAAGGFRTEDMEVNITFGEEKNKGREVKEQPTWMTESTVETSEPGSSVPGIGPSMGMVTADTGDMEEPEGNDEITEMLLRNERSNKDKAGIVIPGDDSDSDNKSDDSDVEQPGYDEAAILAATITNTERDDGVEEMEDDSDDNDDIPTIRVGGEDYDITDVTPDVIAKMSSEELDKYNQLYQDFYKDMYD